MNTQELQPMTESERGLICPCCSSPMVRGTAALEDTILGFLLAGWSALTLFFRTEGRKRIPVLASWKSAEAARCDTCSTMIIFGQRATSVNCRQCGAAIAPGTSKCLKCGLVYSPEYRSTEY